MTAEERRGQQKRKNPQKIFLSAPLMKQTDKIYNQSLGGAGKMLKIRRKLFRGGGVVQSVGQAGQQ
jgi:hypothetical protein